MLTRMRVALRSPDWMRRLIHYGLGMALFSLPQGVRKWVFTGKAHYCPVCGSRLRRFLRLYRRYHLYCPVCRSLQRQRLVWLLLKQEGLLAQMTGGQRLLHFAPEACLEQQFRRLPGLEYHSADLYDGKAMHKIDITHIPFAETSFDWVYCSHVLEHVPEDRQALGELWRVLKPGGKAVILVPLKGEVTDEDPTVTDPMRREERFGQFDHVRQYGMDFIDRLQEVGFEVRVLRQETLGLGEQELLRMGLHTPDVVFLCSKGIRNQG
ncbi:MAG TPA: class I SAM-dependent methyltransferase [Anaerolineales bacterium]|nr:class I SAM-dependent methyltransferase [Anaerolineales bacterium]